MLKHSCHLLPPPQNSLISAKSSFPYTDLALKNGVVPGTTEFLWSGLKRAIVSRISVRRERRHGTEILYSVIGRKDILWWCESISSCWCACCSNGFTPDEPTRDRTRSNRGFPNHLTHKSPSLIPKWMYKAFTITTTFHWGPPNVIQLGQEYFRKQKDLYLCGAMNCLIMWQKLERLTCLKSLIT